MPGDLGPPGAKKFWSVSLAVWAVGPALKRQALGGPGVGMVPFPVAFDKAGTRICHHLLCIQVGSGQQERACQFLKLSTKIGNASMPQELAWVWRQFRKHWTNLEEDYEHASGASSMQCQSLSLKQNFGSRG